LPASAIARAQTQIWFAVFCLPMLSHGPSRLNVREDFLTPQQNYSLDYALQMTDIPHY
jgi:hypothetical protein